VAVPDLLRLDATRLAIGGLGAWGGAPQGAAGLGLESRLPAGDVERSVGQAPGDREPDAPVLQTHSETKRAEPEHDKPDAAPSAARSCAEEVLAGVLERREEPAAGEEAAGLQPAQNPPSAEPQPAA
jgi:hypothetical protein